MRPISRRMMTSLATRKISPAANWHANFLGIDLNEISGSGPKGHILKSDILSFKAKLTHKQDNLIGISDISLLFEIKPTADSIIQKCINRITTANDKIKQVNFKFIPELGFLQLNIKAVTEDDGEKVKKLLNIYLNDTRH